jgi:lathosterol oxidase
MYFLVSHVAVQMLTFLTLLPATVVATYLVSPALRDAVSGQPIWVQVLELMLIADLAQYWMHRAFHRIPWLWPFHAVHHSSRALDWLAGSRLHLVDVLVTRSLILVPIFLLGFAQSALYLWLVIVAFHAIFNHVNLKFRFRWIELLLVTPRFHHWHHAVAPVDKNFAVHFPWLDRLFGTYHMPDDAWPDALGIDRHPVPEGFLPQLVYPFVRR